MLEGCDIGLAGGFGGEGVGGGGGGGGGEVGGGGLGRVGEVLHGGHGVVLALEVELAIALHHFGAALGLAFFGAFDFFEHLLGLRWECVRDGCSLS